MVDRVPAGGEPTRRLASVTWAADQAGISRSVAYCWARAGQLPGCVEMGGRYYVRVAPFLRWLDGQDEDAACDAPDDQLIEARNRKAAAGKAAAAQTEAAGGGQDRSAAGEEARVVSTGTSSSPS
jgi:hypothetical protein